MARNTRNTNGATIPAVKTVVSETMATPLTVGAPIAANTTETAPPTKDTKRGFLLDLATTQAKGELGQLDMGREIGRWASVKGGLTIDDKDNGVAALVLFHQQTRAKLRKKPLPEAKDVKSLVTHMTNCAKVGAIAKIGRAAIDNAHDFAVKYDGLNKVKLFPLFCKAVRVQRDNAAEGVLSEARMKVLVTKEKEEKPDDEKMLENVRALRKAIEKACNLGDVSVENEQPHLPKAMQKKLIAFNDGDLQEMLVALGAGVDEEHDKALAKVRATERAAAAAKAALQDKLKAATNP
jgi:hypothetical protein